MSSVLLQPKEKKRQSMIWGGQIAFLAAVCFGTFFIAEHDIKMSEVQNFVQDIEQQESWGEGGNSARRIAFLGCAFIGLFGIAKGELHRFRWNLPMALLVLYLAWTAGSMTWSIDPGATARRYILMLCCVIGCFGITRFLTMEQVLLATVITLSGLLSVGVLAEIALGNFKPHQGDYRFAGTLHPNSQAANLAMLSISSFTMARLRPKFKWVFYGVMGVAVFFLVITKCRTVTAVLPVSLMVIWLVTQPLKQITIGGLIVVWVFSISVLGFLVAGFDPISEYSEVLLLGRGEETGTSLTGRLPLWTELSSYIKNRPLQGYGFGAFWTPGHINDIFIGQGWVISEAHSSYVDTSLQTGLIGALLMVSIAFSTFFYAVIVYRRTKKTEYVFIIGGVVFCLIRGFTESGLNGPSGFSSSLFLAMAAHSWNASNQESESDCPEQLSERYSVSRGIIYE